MSRHQFLLMLALVGGMIALARGDKSAFPRCTIHQNGKKLQCRGAGLRKIPEIPKGVLIADFSDNLIVHVNREDLKHLEKLEKVYLKGNPFHCDCNLENLRLKLVKNNSPVIQDGENLQCSTPMRIRNKALKSLSELCDITAENKHISKPSSRIQKRNANASVDECDVLKCSRHATCVNNDGSYMCKCNEGYSKQGDQCEDIDECETGAHKCDKTTSDCDNLIGHHRCKCRKGFSKNQEDKCVDIDECTNSSYCGDKTATCNNTIGSHECICRKGYKYDYEKRHCSDINECTKSPCVNTRDCENTEGSYQCICPKGYRKEGNECKEIGHCAEKPCDEDEICENNKCECPAGYTRDNYEKCADTDECKIRMHNCSKQSYCRNIVGSFRCECPKGYEGDPFIKCSLTAWTRFTTPKHLLNDLKRGAWDTILVVAGAGIVLLAIVYLVLRKMCRKCCSQDHTYYTEQMYDPDHMFFTEGEQMYYPDEMAYYPEEEVYYPEGTAEMPDPNEIHYGDVNPDEIHYDDVDPYGMDYGDVDGPLPLQKSASLQHTFYYDYPDDDLSDG